MFSESMELDSLLVRLGQLDLVRELPAIKNYWVGEGLVRCPCCHGKVAVDTKLRKWSCSTCGNSGVFK